MKESPFGFEYTWKDLEPIRELSVVALVFQCTGAIVFLSLGISTDWFYDLWVGGALLSLPGFLIGLVVQRVMRPGSISENIVMVRRAGFVSTLLSLFAIFSPEAGLLNAI